jgi:hypothetical protein
LQDTQAIIIKLTAAQTILDRVGVSKSDKLDVTHTAAGGIFILPEKAPIEVEAQDIEYEEEETFDETEVGLQQSNVGETDEGEEK